MGLLHPCKQPPRITCRAAGPGTRGWPPPSFVGSPKASTTGSHYRNTTTNPLSLVLLPKRCRCPPHTGTCSCDQGRCPSRSQVLESFKLMAAVRHCLVQGANAACSTACPWLQRRGKLQLGSAQALPAALQAARLTVLVIKPAQDKVDANPSIDTCTRRRGSLRQQAKGNQAVLHRSSYLPVSLRSLLHVIWRRGNQTPGAHFSPSPPGLQLAACKDMGEGQMLRDLRQ